MLHTAQHSPANTPFWAMTEAEAIAKAGSSVSGISPEEAAERLSNEGSNAPAAKNTGALLLFWRQLNNPLTLLLLGAALLSLMLHDTTNSYIIFLIVFISSVLGYWQEKGASDAVKTLLKMVKTTCTVRRGQDMEVTVDALVRGDMVVLSAGSVIPADCYILQSNELFVDEAAFTGETFPVQKSPGVKEASARLSERTNAVFMGSHVVSGKGLGLVMHTGRDTEFGKISASLARKAPETDFERGIRQFGYLLMSITMLLVLIIFAINVFLHKPVLDSFMFSLALAVGLTPQLLPAIISVNLSRGAKRMAEQQVIVKKLSSIENFGSMTVLCSDKTGTLTEGKVTGKDYTDASGNPSEQVRLYACLNAALQQGFRNPVDTALMAIQPDTIHSYRLAGEIPYDFVRKRLTTVVTNDKETIMITKGAFLQVLEACTDIEQSNGIRIPVASGKQTLMKLYEEASSKGFRVLGVACKPLQPGEAYGREQETGMSFTGFVSFFDPPKANIANTIASLNTMGIAIKVITGDNRLVASALMKQIGYPDPKILTGKEMKEMSPAALLHDIPITDVFAEVEPNQKELIIETLRKKKQVVGFMGDGINDAAALHTSDVGISVDTAVDVAKEAADIILLNPDLDVLRAGVAEGRTTFANTMKYIFMATSANFGNMFSMAGASLFLPFLPLLPKQILLTNLLTDLPEMTIATDRVDDAQTLRPASWDFSFIRKFMIVFGLLSSAFDYFTFWVLLKVLHADEHIFQTGWFVESVVSASLIVFIVRTRLPVFRSKPSWTLTRANLLVIIAVLALPFLPVSALMGFQPLPPRFYGYLLLIVAAYLCTAEITKKTFYNYANAKLKSQR
jgi:Mg2+-importing ATPase